MPEHQIAKTKTMNEKYGVDHAAQSPVIKAKTVATVFEKYGVEYYFQTEECAEKRNKTFKEKYGLDVTNSMQIPEIKEKVANTLFERTGYRSPSQNPETKNKTINTCNERYGFDTPTKHPDIIQKQKESKIILKNRDKVVIIQRLLKTYKISVKKLGIPCTWCYCSDKDINLFLEKIEAHINHDPVQILQD